MKFKSIMSITITNSYVLFIFASLLAGCEKRQIPRTGLFNSNKTSEKSRNVANTDKDLQKFITFQDPQQIIVYCYNQQSNNESCYNIHFKKTVEQYIKASSIKPKPAILSKVEEHFSYKNVKVTFNAKLKNIEKHLSEKIDVHLEKQRDFCGQNSTLSMKRCLQQYIQRDTLTVLNNFQVKNKLNGHEYIFVKSLLERQYNQKVDSLI